MNPEILDHVTELKGRKTTMEIVNVKIGDRIFKYEIVHRPCAAAAILETEDGRFILIEEFRIPVNKTILEAVAGCLDGDEHPDDCIKREIEEETGHKVVPIHRNVNRNVTGAGGSEVYYLTSVIASPGYSDEIIYLYYAKVSNEAGEQRPDDDERIKVKYFTFDQIQKMVENREIFDAHTLLAWYEYLFQIRNIEVE